MLSRIVLVLERRTIFGCVIRYGERFSESIPLHFLILETKCMSIYVGNLSYEVTQEDLTRAFTEYGTVKRIQLPTDRETGRLRGFCFCRNGYGNRRNCRY